MRRLIVMLLAIAGFTQLAAAAWIPAKAGVAQRLLERAWQRTGAGAIRARPWRWADTWPVARLRSIKHDVDLIVLEGMTGATLAFGPGRLAASVLPGDTGNSVIGAHRDTHFAFLEELAVGDRLLVERSDGREVWFRVASLTVADVRRDRLSLDTGDSRLTLVTCFPFDAVAPGGPLRYVVTAERIATRVPPAVTAAPPTGAAEIRRIVSGAAPRMATPAQFKLQPRQDADPTPQTESGS